MNKSDILFGKAWLDFLDHQVRFNSNLIDLFGQKNYMEDIEGSVKKIMDQAKDYLGSEKYIYNFFYPEDLLKDLKAKCLETFELSAQYLAAKLKEMKQNKVELKSQFELYEIWVDCCNLAYEKMIHHPEHHKVFTSMLNLWIKNWANE